MSLYHIATRYRNIVERLDQADSWVFQQDCTLFPDFAAVRAEKMRTIVDDARSLLSELKTSGQGGDENEAKAYQDLVARLETVLDVGQSLDALVKDPAHDAAVVKLNTETPLKDHYSSMFRTYRYLVWCKRAFAAVPDIKANGVAAVLRVKNEILNMQMILPVLLSYFDEIVIVDHNSTDGTYEYVAGLNNAKIKLSRYQTETARAGEFYAVERNEGKGSLADYYNYAFAQATSAYVCKWDADMYPLPTLGPLLASVRQGACDVILFNGLDCYGYHSCRNEPRIYRKSLGLHFVDTLFFEALSLAGTPVNTGDAGTPIYLHMRQDAMLKMKSGF